MFPGDSQPRNVRDLGGSGLGGIICPGEEDILGWGVLDVLGSAMVGVGHSGIR